MFIKTTFLIIAVTSANAVSLQTAATSASNVAKLFKDAKGPAKVAKACLGGIMANTKPLLC